MFDLVLHKLGKFTVGAGPLLVIPSAGHSNMGDGKWQAGVAGSVVTNRSWGLVGTIITYSRWYLRSSGIWNIEYGNHRSVIPIGFGIGKVTRLRSGIVMNLNIEPERAVHYTGPGQPIWQILTAATFQFPERAKPTTHH